MSEVDKIKKFLLDYFDVLDDRTKRFLLSYMVRRYSREEINAEKTYVVDNLSIIKDIKVLNNVLFCANDNSLKTERITEELVLLEKLFESSSPEEVNDVSFELEKLYSEVGMPVRNTDTVIKKIEYVREKGM